MVGSMIDIDRRYGPFTGRVWGLIINLAANALALYGLAGFLREGTHLVYLTVGIAGTVACVLVLAKPSS
jgi:hypothetical protein